MKPFIQLPKNTLYYQVCKMTEDITCKENYEQIKLYFTNAFNDKYSFKKYKALHKLIIDEAANELYLNKLNLIFSKVNGEIIGLNLPYVAKDDYYFDGIGSFPANLQNNQTYFHSRGYYKNIEFILPKGSSKSFSELNKKIINSIKTDDEIFLAMLKLIYLFKFEIGINTIYNTNLDTYIKIMDADRIKEYFKLDLTFNDEINDVILAMFTNTTNIKTNYAFNMLFTLSTVFGYDVSLKRYIHKRYAYDEDMVENHKEYNPYKACFI